MPAIRKSWCRGLLLAAFLPALLFAQPAAAQLPAMTPVQQANVGLALHNLAALIKRGRAMLPDTPANEVDAARKKEAERQLAKLQEIYDNLAGKLKGGNIHPVTGMKAGKPKKYKLDNHPPGNPRAAYCEGDTWILEGKKWIPCPEGDILVDGGIIDPGNGKPIDVSTPQGWQWKWTLLHVLAHERMHEIMIAEQLAILKARPWWKDKTPAERERLIASAKRIGSTPERHQQAYEWQKNVLRLEAEVLMGELRRLQNVKPKPDAKAIKEVEAKIKWLAAEVSQLEKDMEKATNDNEFAFASCTWKDKPSEGLVDIYITAAGLYWKIQTVMKKGKAGPVSVAEASWLGKITWERPLSGRPVQFLVMPETVFTGLHVQPEPCDYLQESIAGGRLFVTKDRAAAVARLSSRAAAQGK